MRMELNERSGTLISAHRSRPEEGSAGGGGRRRPTLPLTSIGGGDCTTKRRPRASVPSSQFPCLLQQRPGCVNGWTDGRTAHPRINQPLDLLTFSCFFLLLFFTSCRGWWRRGGPPPRRRPTVGSEAEARRRCSAGSRPPSASLFRPTAAALRFRKPPPPSATTQIQNRPENSIILYNIYIYI